MAYPETAKHQVLDEYHGIQVQDDYRWLEDPTDPRVRAWVEAQNTVTRAFLDQVPYRQKIFDQVKSWYSSTSSDYFSLRQCGGRLFAIKFQPPKQQPFLVALESADEPVTEQTILDPNQLDPSGGTSIDFYVPALDGRHVAVSLSKSGSEEGTVYVYDVETGERLPDEVPRVNYPTAGGSVAWNADGSGFYYTRYPRGQERPPEDRDFYQQVYFHRLGEPTESDTYAIGQEFPRIAEIALQVSEDGRFLLANVRNGDGGEFAHYLMDPSGAWSQVSRFEDQCQEGVLGVDESLYLLSRKDAPRGKIVRLPLANPRLEEAQTIVPQQVGAIQHFLPTERRLYIVESDGGPSRLSVFDFYGNELAPVPVEPVSSIFELVRRTGDEILFRTTSFITPPAWQCYDPVTDEVTRTALFVTSPVDFSDCEVLREFAVSHDGTLVPVNIILRKDTQRDGQNPVHLTGYGGYGISLTPQFNATRRLWLDRGGILVVANLRGGGEYGEDWHRAGYLENKQNVFDDFVACAQHLIERKYTNPSKLCILGGSNGGLLMGAALTQHPELFQAVVARVGIFDMLRVELDPNGAFNVTEFGTVKNPQQFEALYSYSPYHHVVDGTDYPAVLLMTGENDGRVNPAHSRKMAARLQAAARPGRPILLRNSTSSGHGHGTSLDETIAEIADIHAFLFSQLGLE